MRRSSWLMLMAVTVSLWAGVRLWLMVGADAIAPDGTTYIRMARGFAHAPGEVIAGYDYAIGYPAVVSGVHSIWSSLTGDQSVEGWDRIGQAVSFVASLAVLAGLWSYCRRAFDDRVALATLVLLCVGRKWAAIGADVLSDSLALAFAVWAIVLALAVQDRLCAGRRSGLWLAFLVGLLAGLGYLVRPEAILAVVLALGLWVVMQVRRRQNVRLSLVAVGLAAVSAIACALPYMIATGGLSKKKSLSDFIGQTIGNPPTVIMAGLGFPADAPFKLIGQFSEAIHPVSGFLLAFWLLLALVRPLRRRMLPTHLQSLQPDVAFLMALGAVIMVPALIGLYANVHYLSHRHLLLLGVLTSPLIGAGAVSVADWISRLADLAAKPVRRDAVLAAFLAICAVPMAIHAVKPLHKSGEIFRQAGLFVRENTSPGDFVLTDNPYILHYSDRAGCRLPSGSFDALSSLAAGHGNVVLAMRDADIETARKRNRDLTFTQRYTGNGLVDVYAITMQHN